MPGLLHLDASARSRSFSRRFGDRFATGWRAAHPGAGYVHRDLAADPVPFIGEAWTELCDEVMRRRITDPRRYAEVVRTPAQQAAWDVVAPLLDELLAADVVLVATPMYNFTVPAALKAWIDQVTFPRMALTGTRFVVVCARGGTYLPGTPRAAVEHAADYLRDFLDGHFGVTDVAFVTPELTNALVDPVLAGRRPEHEASVAVAEAQVDRLVAAYSPAVA
ncbi:FMN-dependent NADH-azoreductase [Pseudonocardia sp. MH-G8]|uniref:FMN-dependent NADH-azoreductase n=1 Tax=Pseudonocardia sp. MH-G8 TaxID=1854588 RepID=UPI000BA174B5|nr:NAD(P)H-dependent oxidoreductase [Pseudonocardia sp. MH-G8]OZM84060.1 FMN-dependent NADH-azoreductase [Pseudonocardia sp. MH-G8]